MLIDPTTDVPTDGVPEFFYKEFAFAGVTTWTPPVVTWDHVIDSSLERTVDANPITWEDGVVVERGKATVGDREVAFAEEWLRMTDDDVISSADPREMAVRIEVGRYAVEIEDSRPNGGFVATRYDRQGSDWVAFGKVRA